VGLVEPTHRPGAHLGSEPVEHLIGLAEAPGSTVLEFLADQLEAVREGHLGDARGDREARQNVPILLSEGGPSEGLRHGGRADVQIAGNRVPDRLTVGAPEEISVTPILDEPRLLKS
jgi:hypothetical protein